MSSGRVHYSEIDKESLLFYEKNPDDYIVIEDTTKQLGITEYCDPEEQDVSACQLYPEGDMDTGGGSDCNHYFRFRFIQQTNGIFNPEVAE